MKRGGEAGRHLACKKTICVSTSVGTEERSACGPARAYVSLWEAEYDFVRTVVYLCAIAMVYTCGCVHFFHRLSLALLLSLW